MTGDTDEDEVAQVMSVSEASVEANRQSVVYMKPATTRAPLAQVAGSVYG